MTALGIVFRPQHEPAQLRATAETAERVGVDELWLWEDCFDHGGVATAAAALAWTERLRVGIGVLPVPLRNPALAAMEAATLARLFPGRVSVGFGHGVLDWMGQVGARAESPMTLLREYLTALRALLDGAEVTASGRYVQLGGVRLGRPSPGLALHVAATGPKTVALAGELGDGLVLTSSRTPEQIRAAVETFTAARSGRPGRVTAYLLTDDVADGGASVAASVAASVRELAAAGVDAVVLESPADTDPIAFARFAGEQVRPLLD